MQPNGKIAEVFDFLKRPGGPSLTIDQINEMTGHIPVESDRKALSVEWRHMLSVIVLCEEGVDRAPPRKIDPAEALVRTLASLVRANVEGLLRDVHIAGPEDHGLDLIADHAGCGLVQAPAEAAWLRLALEAARGPDLLLLRSGHAPELSFIEEAGDFVSGRGGTSRTRTARLHVAPEAFLERLFPRLAPLAGLIAPRDLCLLAPPSTFKNLVRHVGKAPALRSVARRVG